ncbi:MAG: pyrimidine dimer DNA glycosylase/endonuclease V [Bacteroidales bacterium]
MRIWSLHPKYLDTKGFVALWRETLLAKQILEGKTKGYKNHPQLNRFKSSGNAVGYINQYLIAVYENSVKRGYNFDENKISPNFTPAKLTVTKKQIKFEMRHLLNKLETRDPERFRRLSRKIKIDAHPLFRITEGEIETWEKL